MHQATIVGKQYNSIPLLLVELAAILTKLSPSPIRSIRLLARFLPFCLPLFRMPRRRPSYIYVPLDPASPELRVIQFLPNEEGTINLRLMHVSHGSSYHCLSYRWGKENPSQERKVFINGMRFLVHPNLWSFLDVARRKYPNYLFWIDAICIDQRNLEEKAIVVKRMGQIYKEAAGVMIWLGMGSYFEERLIAHISGYGQRKYGMPSVKRGKMRKAVLNQDEFHADIPELSRRLCSNEYWTRAWIVQEVALATSKVVVQGFQEVSWFDFAGFVDDTSNLRGSLAGRIVRAESTFTRSYSRSSLHKLFNTNLRCLYNQDKIFSLLSLVHGGENVVVDYELKLEELFFRVLSSLASDNVFACARVLLEVLVPELFERLKELAPQQAGSYDEIRWDNWNLEDKPFLVVNGWRCQGDCREALWNILRRHERWDWLDRRHEVCSNCAATEYFVAQPWLQEDPQFTALGSECIIVITLELPFLRPAPGHFLFVHSEDRQVWRCREFVRESTVHSDGRLLSGITLHADVKMDWSWGRLLKRGEISFSRFEFMNLLHMTWNDRWLLSGSDCFERSNKNFY